MSSPASNDEKTTSSGRLLIAAALAAILGLLALTMFLLRPPKAESKRGPQPRASAAAPVLEWAPEEALVEPAELARVLDAGAIAAPVPGSETVDLFSGPAPEVISRGHDIVERGGRLHSKRVKELHELGKQSPGDARPHLVLALDSMNRGWYGFAISHYKRAVTENPDAAKDPHVMKARRSSPFTVPLHCRPRVPRPRTPPQPATRSGSPIFETS